MSSFQLGSTVPAVGFAATPLQNSTGWTFTLTTLLGDCLSHAEAQFGQRDLTYTVLGVEFGGPNPKIWYPGDCKHVSVMLSASCLNDIDRAIFQLAHEVVHLLSPTGQSDANVLEEGLATHFQHYYSKLRGIAYTNDDQKYLAAERDVQTLLALKHDAIKLVRQTQPCISKITDQQLLAVCPHLRPEIAQRLSDKF